MSYDIWLVETVAEVGNYTSNVSGMWHKALGFSLGDLHGTMARDAIEPLGKAIANMINSPDEYTKLEPDNGWGNREGAMKYLARLLDECSKHPDAEIRISR